jgi:hypothetical protein
VLLHSGPATGEKGLKRRKKKNWLGCAMSEPTEKILGQRFPSNRTPRPVTDTVEGQMRRHGLGEGCGLGKQEAGARMSPGLQKLEIDNAAGLPEFGKKGRKETLHGRPRGELLLLWAARGYCLLQATEGRVSILSMTGQQISCCPIGWWYGIDYCFT